jgi:hypothetical protein
MISAIIGSSNAERDGRFPGTTLVSELAYQEDAALTADLFRRHLHVAQLPMIAFIYIAYGTKQRLSHVAANSCAP